MASATVYIKCDQNIESLTDDIYLKDVASVQCADTIISAKCKAIKIYHFKKEEKEPCVISVLKLIALIEETCPGVSVQSVGEPDVVIERVFVDTYKGPKQWWKIVLVCLVSFFGTSFTIMAFHNDIGINEVFTEVYRIFMNTEPEGLNVMEVAYSIGLALGIIVFFNHIGPRKLTKDPTPLEVAMRTYEDDVNNALIKSAGREGKEIDI